MLVSLNIIPTAEIDLNIVMADVLKSQEQREFFPENFQEDNASTRRGTREVSKLGQRPAVVVDSGTKAPVLK